MRFKYSAAVLIAAFTASADATTTSSIGLEMSSANPKLSSADSTVVYMANTNYQPCLCDQTYEACDAFCCCDDACPQVRFYSN